MLIQSRDGSEGGMLVEVTAQQAGWDFLNVAVRRLMQGERWAGQTDGHECVHVILSGRCHVHTTYTDYLNVGRRADVFSGLPFALYLPRNTGYMIEAVSDGFEVASCWVPTEQDHPARLITPDQCRIELRGGGNASRQVVSVVPPGFDCQRIVCVEAYIPGGNWAGYPPHKHDQHREDASGTLLEADLEEVYFYKMQPAEGFAVQRIYSPGRDDTFVAHHNDLVLIHDGYHPTVSAPGYTTYLLNFLAGSAQSLANSDDPAHAWVKQAWGSLDPRLPVVD